MLLNVLIRIALVTVITRITSIHSAPAKPSSSSTFPDIGSNGLPASLRDQAMITKPCYQEEYLCRGGTVCVNRRQLCNDIKDCPSGDDEATCRPKRPCEVGFYQCRASYRCVPLFLVCDGHPDCPLGDDEIGECGHGGQHRQKATRVTDRNVTASNTDNSVKVNASKQFPSTETQVINYQHNGSGYFFINFGTIFNGNENVNGKGNDLGNGNGNGNDDGNGNGVGNGNANDSEDSSKPSGLNYKSWKSEPYLNVYANQAKGKSYG